MKTIQQMAKQKQKDLQKKKKDIKDPQQVNGKAPALTQNNTFIGTTKELQQAMIKKLAEKNVSDTASTL